MRDRTISRLYRKFALAAKGVARGFANAHPDKNASEILASFNYSNFSQRFSRVHPNELPLNDYGTWTFYSDLKQASETFGKRGTPILPQVRKFNKIMKEKSRPRCFGPSVKRDKALETKEERKLSDLLPSLLPRDFYSLLHQPIPS